MPTHKPCDEVNILSKKHGGRSGVKTYCRHFYQRPPHLTLTLCAGYEDERGKIVYDPCPDLLLCLRNKAKAGEPKATIKKSGKTKKPQNRLEEAGDQMAPQLS